MSLVHLRLPLARIAVTLCSTPSLGTRQTILSPLRIERLLGFQRQVPLAQVPVMRLVAAGAIVGSSTSAATAIAATRAHTPGLRKPANIMATPLPRPRTPPYVYACRHARD